MLRRSLPVATLSVLLPVCIATAELELYVSTAGDDGWSGRIAEADQDGTDGPFATLERARDEIRRLRLAGRLAAGPITVNVRGGEYFRDQTFELAAEDGAGPGGKGAQPVTYRAYRNEQVRLIGGRRVEDWKPVTDAMVLERLDPAARDHVLQADLAAHGVTDFGKLTARGFGRPITPAGLELFFQDRPMQVARWPNEGWVRTTGADKGKFNYDGDRLARWVRADDLWVHGFWTWDWADSFEKVRSIDLEANQIATEPPHGVYGYQAGKRFYVLNLLEELDEPGEWYLDRGAGILYFWPPAPIESGEAIVSVLETMISLEGVSDVTLQGLTIEAVRGTAITLKDCVRTRIAGCTLKNLGNLAVRIEGGRESGVIGCDIYHCGDGGITLIGGDRRTLTPAGHYAINNHIHHYSRWCVCYRSAINITGVGHRVAHNLIHDSPHMAIGLHGNEHVIELNEIHTVCMDTDDAGAFYMGRDWTWRGNIVRYNYFHNIGAYSGRVGVQSVYLDDWASGTTVYGNLFYRAGRGILLGGGRDTIIENNVFVGCNPSIHVDSRGLGWAKNYFDGTTTTLTDRLNQMPYREPTWSTKYPELLTLYDDEPAVAKGNLIRRNISVDGRWLALHDGLTEEIVRVEDNLVDTDPHFVDTENRDFRLREDSPAFELGFKPLPLERMGLYEDELRASWPPRLPAR